MKTCKNCGAQLPDQAMFCTSCGSPLEEIEDTTVLNEEYEGTTVLTQEDEINEGTTVLIQEEDFNNGTTVLSEDELFNSEDETTLLVKEEEMVITENKTTIENSDNAKPEKPKKKGKFIAAVIAVILIGAIGVIFGVPELRYRVLDSLGFYDDYYEDDQPGSNDEYIQEESNSGLNIDITDISSVDLVIDDIHYTDDGSEIYETDGYCGPCFYGTYRYSDLAIDDLLDYFAYSYQSGNGYLWFNDEEESLECDNVYFWYDSENMYFVISLSELNLRTGNYYFQMNQIIETENEQEWHSAEIQFSVY